MKRRGVAIASNSSRVKRSWREEAKTVDEESCDSLGEPLPSSDDEEPVPAAQEPAQREVQEEPTKTQSEPNPVIWLQLRIGERVLGKLFFELFHDLHPGMAESFAGLCDADQVSDASGRSHSLPGLAFHRIPSGLAIESAEVVVKVFGDAEDLPMAKNMGLSHSRMGLLSLEHVERDIARLLLTLRPASKELDRRCCVVGQLLGTRAPEGPMDEQESLHPFRHLDAVAGVVRELCMPIAVEASGVSATKIATSAGESERDRYARAGFCLLPLGEVVSADNAKEVLDLVNAELDEVESSARMLEAATSIEAEAVGSVALLRSCAVLEVKMTRLLLLLEEVDFRTLGDVRTAGKSSQRRIRALQAKIAHARAGVEEGETEAYQQRPGL